VVRRCVHRLRRRWIEPSWGEGDQGGLVALADDADHTVSVGHGKVGELGTAGFGHAQGVASEQAGQSVVVAAGQPLDTKQAAAALIRDLDILLAKFRPLIFTVAVDKVRVLELGAKGQPPLGAAYAFLMQRVARTMEDLHNGDGAILVADQQHEHEQLFRSGEINRVRDHFHQSLGRQPNYNVVLDKPLWIDTNLSTWDRRSSSSPTSSPTRSAGASNTAPHPPAPRSSRTGSAPSWPSTGAPAASSPVASRSTPSPTGSRLSRRQDRTAA
jgi:hypothetical protein